MSSPTPVLLLKTRSFPTDSYHDLLSSSLAAALSVRFVPVLQHTFHEPGVERLRYLLLRRLVGAQSSCSYGGLVFTSQRAVEAFANVVEEERKGTTLSLPRVPVFLSSVFCFYNRSPLPPPRLNGRAVEPCTG